MYRLIVLSALLACACANVLIPVAPQLDGRIVGGEDTNVQAFPYQVSVRLLGGHMCGGSILNERVIVTAAHCIYNVGASFYSVQYGVTTVGGTNNVINAERVVKHPGYNAATITNDVALIFLSSDIPFGSTAQPIALASSEPTPGTQAVVSGWGATSEGGASSSVLQEVAVTIVDKKVCSQEYAQYNDITPEMLCAGVGGGKDACQGDSGGPLAANGQLVGIVSWGVGCARPEFSGVYSNVYTLSAWIQENIA